MMTALYLNILAAVKAAALAPDLAPMWINGHVMIAILSAGILAALLMKLKWGFTRVIGLVLYGVQTFFWGWYSFSFGYWDGAMFMYKPVLWVLAILFPLATFICRPAPAGKGTKLGLRQFSLLVILIALAYLAAVLMVSYWELHLWADVVFFGLPLLYLLLLLLAGHVSVDNLLMGIPAAMVTLLIAISAVRQSTGASIVLSLAIYAVLGIVLIFTLAGLGSVIGDTPTVRGSSTTATNLHYDPLEDIRERNRRNQNN